MNPTALLDHVVTVRDLCVIAGCMFAGMAVVLFVLSVALRAPPARRMPTPITADAVTLDCFNDCPSPTDCLMNGCRRHNRRVPPHFVTPRVRKPPPPASVDR